MISIYLRGAVAAGAICVASSAFAGTNLVSDGDFSSPYGGSVFTTYAVGSTIGPWNVTGDSVDLIGGYWQAPNSAPNTGSVDLDGNNVGGINQALTLTAGETYDLSFYLSGNPDGGSPTKDVTVSVGGLTEQLTYTVTGANSHSDMLYELETFSFVAGSSNTLSFVSDDVNSAYGPVVGGISVTAVPETSTWAMMGLGLLGLAFAGYRARRDAIFIA